MNIYVDFDGVLNSLTRNHQLLEKKTDYRGWYNTKSPADSGAFDLNLSTERNYDLIRIASLEGIDFHWLTTWYQYPSVPLKEVGVNAPFLDGTTFDPKVIEFDDYGRKDWKTTNVVSRHKNSDRFIWIDDDAIPRRFQRRFPNALLIRPSSVTGLTKNHINSIFDYAGK